MLAVSMAKTGQLKGPLTLSLPLPQRVASQLLTSQLQKQRDGSNYTWEKRLTLKEISYCSPPQISKPGSYPPNSQNHFRSTANSPPAITGDLLEKEHGVRTCSQKPCFPVVPLVSPETELVCWGLQGLMGRDLAFLHATSSHKPLHFNLMDPQSLDVINT